MAVEVRDKSIMRALYLNDQFGNRLRAWSIAEIPSIREDAYPVAFMYNGQPGVVLPLYVEPLANAEEAMRLAHLWASLGCAIDRITVSEFPQAHGNATLVNMEVMRSERHLDVRYAYGPLPMRQSFAGGTVHLDGAMALARIQAWMDTASRENLDRLLDEYDGHVVECSVFARSLGTLGWNTVFWEVRAY